MLQGLDLLIYLLKSIPRALRLRCFPFLMREVHSLTPFIRFPVEAHVQLKKEISSLYLWLSFTSVYLNKCSHMCSGCWGQAPVCSLSEQTVNEDRQTKLPPWGSDLFTLFSALFKSSCVKAGALFFFLLRICDCESYVKQIGAPLGDQCCSPSCPLIPTEIL